MNRDINVDRYRGLLVLLMILFGFASYFQSFGIVHQLSGHAPDSFPKTEVFLSNENNIKSAYIAPNMTVCDLASCAFFLMIGLTIVGSFNRRKAKYGKKEAVKLILKRYLKIIGIGSIMSIIYSYIDSEIINTSYYGMVILSVLLLLLYILYFILKLFKSKYTDKLKNLNEKLLIIIGMYNIIINSINMIFMCAGKTEEFWGVWGVLQHIGFAGIITIIIISILRKNDTKDRFIAGLLILICYTLFHETTLPTLSNNINLIDNMRLIDSVPDGGVFGGIAYGGILLLYTAFADIYYKSKKKSYICLFVLGAISLIIIYYVSQSFTAWNGSNSIFTAGISNHFSINKGSISPTYLIIDTFWCILVFDLFTLFEKIKIKFDLLKILGRNAMLMFILEFILIDIVIRFISNVSLFVAFIECTIILFILIFISFRLYKKNIIIKL